MFIVYSWLAQRIQNCEFLKHCSKLINILCIYSYKLINYDTLTIIRFLLLLGVTVGLNTKFHLWIYTETCKLKISRLR